METCNYRAALFLHDAAKTAVMGWGGGGEAAETWRCRRSPVMTGGADATVTGAAVTGTAVSGRAVTGRAVTGPIYRQTHQRSTGPVKWQSTSARCCYSEWKIMMAS